MTLTDAWLWVRNSSSVSVFPDLHIFFSINFLLPQTWLLYLSAIITAILIVSYQQINKALNYPQAFVFKSFRLNSPVLTSLFHENTGDSVDFEEMVPIRFISREKHVFLVGFSLAFLKFPFQESKKWLTSLYLYYQQWNEIFPEKSRCCSYLVIYKEGIALQFKLVIGETINISSMEESTSKWGKFRRHKRKTIITPYKIEKRNELPITLIKTFEFTSFVIGYHVYKDPWTLEWRKKLKAINKPTNAEDKFAVPIMKRMIVWLCIYQKKNPAKFPEMFFISYTSVIVTSARRKSLANLSINEMGNEWSSSESLFFFSWVKMYKHFKAETRKDLQAFIYLKLFWR